MILIKKISPVLYALIILCFLLPFFNISCSGNKIMTLTGLQLVNGTEFHQQDKLSDQKTRDIDPEPLARFALITAAAGLLIGFLRIKNIPLISMVLSFGGAVLLLLLLNKLNSDITSEGQGIVTIQSAFGFWIALLFFIASGVVQGVIYYDEKKNV